MNNEEKQRNYDLAIKLLSEQNFAAAIIAGDFANEQQIAEIRSKLGLDQPILNQ